MYWALILLGICANAAASILVKTAPAIGVGGLAALVTNWKLIGSLGLYGVAFLSYAVAVQRLPLNFAHPVSTAGAIVLVGLSSAFGFHEKFGAYHLLGYGLLLGGICVLTLAGMGEMR